MKICGIIPARFASTRFPGKPLADIAGKSMIQRVYEQAKKASCLTEVIVATDDQRIFDHVKDFGGQVQMTSSSHQSGTDRCAEVARNHPQFDIFINIQGDEPFIDPGQIDLLCGCFSNEEIGLATLIKRIENIADLHNPNIPKVIIDKNLEAIYFSRAALPYMRDLEPGMWLKNHQYFKHIGIYGYKKETLFQVTALPVSTLEKAEALEQLRWLEQGYTIKVAITGTENLAIDTPADLEHALKVMKL